MSTWLLFWAQTQRKTAHESNCSVPGALSAPTETTGRKTKYRTLAVWMRGRSARSAAHNAINLSTVSGSFPIYSVDDPDGRHPAAKPRLYLYQHADRG